MIEQDDIQAVVDVLKTRWLSLGPKVMEFEEKFAKYIGCKYAVAVNSGTSALHLCIKSLGIGPGDEVITSPFTFVATANCALFEGATPVFADIELDTYNIDPVKIEDKITDKTKAIIDVDIFGVPSNKDAIRAIAEKHGLKVIEDTAEAIGAEYKEKRVGSFFDCSIFAFYPNKQMTTGEGGMIVTDNKEIYELAVSYRNQGRAVDSKWLDHVRLGYNYRLSEINSALGITQLSKIDKILDKRQKVAEEYNRHLNGITGIKTPIESTQDFKVSWFVYVIEVINKEMFMKRLTEKGIQCADYFRPVHLMKFYREKFGFKEGDYPICEEVAAKTVALPFYSNMTKEDIDFVCQKVIEVNNEIQNLT